MGWGEALKNAAREATEQPKRALRCEAEGNTTQCVLHRHATQLLTRPYSRQPPFDTICLTQATLIKGYTRPGDAAFDLASGKGGDFAKWQNAQIAYYVGADIAASSVEDARNRYNADRRPFPARLFAGKGPAEGLDARSAAASLDERQC